MNHRWLEEARKRLQAEAAAPSEVPFDRLRAQGMINDCGEVTGQLHRWNAFLAITEVKRLDAGNQIAAFRCLKPVFGMPGDALIDVSRESMVDYLRAGRKIITAHRDERLGIWKEGCDVRHSAHGFVVCETGADGADNVGNLPEFKAATAPL